MPGRKTASSPSARHSPPSKRKPSASSSTAATTTSSSSATTSSTPPGAWPTSPTRSHALRTLGTAAAGILAAPILARADDTPTLANAPEPLHDLSPWLYMQFMEPLGTTDGSVEASWDHLHQKWRPDLIAAT